MHINNIKGGNDLWIFQLHTQYTLVQIFNVYMSRFFITLSKFCESVLNVQWGCAQIMILINIVLLYFIKK
jgi:hypothetical protein